MGDSSEKLQGIKIRAVLSKTMERTAENRVIFRVGIKKKKSRNPHGYWIFQWRKRWDSNPRAREGYLISSQARYDHFDTLPYILFIYAEEQRSFDCQNILAKTKASVNTKIDKEPER